ncbi:AsmA-like C-terminal region-containing protein [Ostreiculturibacter nitratireducens]|uniref:AsmA-like C-terminal region-containing protein n=1 Tax=Ostreiculturibacter nitratireducens TaxID=3075226 RepID=UPI0031B5B10F
MSETDEGRRRRRGRFGLWLLMSVALIGFLAVLAVLGLTGRPLPAPDWLVDRIEARANAVIAGQGRMTLDSVELVVDERYVPRVRMKGLELFTATGARLAELPELRVTLKPQPVLRGKLEPRRIRLSEANITLARDVNGSLGLSFGEGAGFEFAYGSLPEVLDAIDRTFAQPILKGIELIDAEKVNITLDDARTGKVWRVSDGRATLTQDAQEVALDLGFMLAGIGTRPASAELDFTAMKRSKAARFGARVSNVSAADLAAQSPALAWLGALDAPISGSFRSGIDEFGAVAQLQATLEIGAGALRPTEAAKPVPFDQAKVQLAYTPATAQLDFSEITLDGRALRARADGKAWLEGMEAGFPEALVAQVRIADLQADPEGLFQSPVRFSQGAVDLKLVLDPFALRIGQLALVDEERRIVVSGDVAAGPEGWTAAFDADVNAITHDRLLALWPLALVPKTRSWIAENVTTGELFDVRTAARLAPGVEPRFSLGYEYRGAEVRVLRTLPPIQDGEGYATIEDNAYTLVLDRGHLTAPNGGEVDMAGSVLRVPDVRIKPAPAEITLRTDSTITAALSLLDEPPFQFLTKAGRDVEIADGHARSETRLSLPLKDKVPPDEVGYDVTARLTDVTSDRIVPGRVIAAEALDLVATPAGMSISGPGTVSGVPFRGTWTQGFGPDQKGRSRVDGTVELGPVFLDAFNVGLPEGSVTGQGPGEIEIETVPDAPPRFRLTSDLNGLRLSLPQIGWSKPIRQTGALEISGALGAPPKIDAVRLSAPGLSAEGSISLNEGSGLDLARFTRVDLGWFRGSVDLRGRGAGRSPAVAVTGGTADMRRANLGKGSGGQGGSGGGTPLRVALDALQISEGIRLTGFRGEFDTGGGLRGNFQGRVNGEAPVAGTVSPAQGGRSAFRVHSDDAGEAFRAAGIFARGRGGTMDLALDPVGEAGIYDGRVVIQDIRVRDAPVLAELLGALSVVGLLEQLGGEGIFFTDVAGRFRLHPHAVELQSGRAVGASLGVTMAGVYDIAGKQMDMQGVISPVYIVNALGQVVSKPGEGLFGFNYRLTGSADAPKVSVNPLSILTPGFFREIFRRPIPKVSQ